MAICMSINTDIYGVRASGCAHGDVFTKPEVVAFMLDKANYRSDRDLSNISVLEPACGEGEFLIQICERLKASSELYGFSFDEVLESKVKAYDIDGTKIEACKERIKARTETLANLDHVLTCEDFLKAEISNRFDLVVGNPPYIRFENIPQETLNDYKRIFKTFYYRSDIYVPFYEKSLSLLNYGGRHLFICSNRWLKNEYGKRLRAFIASGFWLKELWNLEEASPFLEDVAAYTAITVIERSILNTRECEYAKIDDIKLLGDNAHKRKRPLPDSSDWSSLFVDNTNDLFTIEQFGFKSGIGAATGADRIFISKELPNFVEEDLLLRAINSKDLAGNVFLWRGFFLLNPFDQDGELIDLLLYPKAHNYLKSHYEILRKRHIAKHRPELWYKTIDRINPNLLAIPKILLPDMSANRRIFVDDGKYYPLHNLYYITGASIERLQALAAVLMSDYTLTQLSKLTTRMNGGFPRWQSQHLKKLRFPNIYKDSECVEGLREAYWDNDLKRINSIVSSLVE